MNTKALIKGREEGRRLEVGRAGGKVWNTSAAWSLLKVQCGWSRKSRSGALCCVLYACWQPVWLAFTVAFFGCFQKAPKQTRMTLLACRKTCVSAYSIIHSTVLHKMADKCSHFLVKLVQNISVMPQNDDKITIFKNFSVKSDRNVNLLLLWVNEMKWYCSHW